MIKQSIVLPGQTEPIETYSVITKYDTEVNYNYGNLLGYMVQITLNTYLDTELQSQCLSRQYTRSAGSEGLDNSIYNHYNWLMQQSEFQGAVII